MTGMSIDVVIDGGQVGQRLAQLEHRLADLRDALGETGEIVQASTFDRFGQGVDPNGAPWVPLAASTLALKVGPGPLRESLHLQNSIRYQVEGNQVRIGTNVPYARAQQFGLPARIIRPRNGKALAFGPSTSRRVVAEVHHPGMPARPFLGFSSQDEQDVLEMLADYLAGE